MRRLLIGWVLVGCAPKRAPAVPEGDAVVVEPPPPSWAALDPTRAVVVTPDGRCPTPAAGWTATPWVALAPVARRREGEEPGPADARSRFCLVAGGAGAPFPELGDARARAVALSEGRSVSWERRAAFSQTALSDSPAGGGAERFAALAGATDVGPGTGAVRLVVVDAPGVAEARARAARALVCADGPCPIEVVPVPVGEGGAVVLSALAAAIAGEAAAHAARVAADGDAAPRLVLDVGLAWHPLHGGGHPDSRDLLEEGQTWRDADGRERVFSWRAVAPSAFAPDVRAVYDALAWARCVGAVTVAPAGDASAGPDGDRGPLLPAAWGALPPDLLPSCREFALDALPDAGHALAWVVGATDDAGRPWAASRSETVPPLLAVGEAVVPGERRQGATSLAGSGVAAGVVATAAAALWALDPSLPAGQVVQRVIAAGTPGAEVTGALRTAVSWLVPARLASAGALPAVDVPAVAAFGEPLATVVRVCDVTRRVPNGPGCRSSAPPARAPLPAGDRVAAAYPGAPARLAACGPVDVYAAPVEGEAPGAWPCPGRQRYGAALVRPASPEACHDCALDVTSGVVAASSSLLGRAEAITLRVQGAERTVELAVPVSAAADGRLSWRVAVERLPGGVQGASLAVATPEGVVLWALPLVGA